MKDSKFAKIGIVSADDKLEIFSKIPSPIAGEDKGLSLRTKQSNPKDAVIAGRVSGPVPEGFNRGTRNLAVKPLISENIFSLKKSWQSTEII
jgi:hypothetical protein